MRQFSIAIANYHKCSGLKQQKFCKSEVLRQTVFFLEVLGENLLPHLSQLVEAACIPWVLSGSLPPFSEYINATSAPLIPSPSSAFGPLAFCL